MYIIIDYRFADEYYLHFCLNCFDIAGPGEVLSLWGSAITFMGIAEIWWCMRKYNLFHNDNLPLDIVHSMMVVYCNKI